MKVYTIANQKGGVGKTTTVINLAAGFGMVGKHVLVVDIDGQCNATTFLLRGRSKRDLKYLEPSIYDVLKKPHLPLQRTIRKTREHNVSIVPSGDILKGSEVDFSRVEQAHLLLWKRIAEAEELGFEYVIIDTPPGSELFQMNGLFAAHKVIAVTTYNQDSLEGLDTLIEDLHYVHQVSERPVEVSVLYSMTRNTVKCDKERENLQKKYGEFLHPIEIPAAEMVERARDAAQSILRYAPTNPVAVAYSLFVGQELSHEHH